MRWSSWDRSIKFHRNTFEIFFLFFENTQKSEMRKKNKVRDRLRVFLLVLLFLVCFLFLHLTDCYCCCCWRFSMNESETNWRFHLKIFIRTNFSNSKKNFLKEKKVFLTKKLHRCRSDRRHFDWKRFRPIKMLNFFFSSLLFASSSYTWTNEMFFRRKRQETPTFCFPLFLVHLMKN